MTNQKSNKELVAAGHAFAIAQGADAPLTEIAKLVSDLATRLDVMTVRADVLAAENIAIKSRKPIGYIKSRDMVSLAEGNVANLMPNDSFGEAPVYLQVETPATDGIANELRAEGVEMFAREKIKLRDLHAEDRNSEMVKANDYCAMTAEEFATQLRSCPAMLKVVS